MTVKLVREALRQVTVDFGLSNRHGVARNLLLSITCAITGGLPLYRCKPPSSAWGNVRKQSPLPCLPLSANPKLGNIRYVCRS